VRRKCRRELVLVTLQVNSSLSLVREMRLFWCVSATNHVPINVRAKIAFTAAVMQVVEGRALIANVLENVRQVPEAIQIRSLMGDAFYTYQGRT
jgi:hypothetical protein